MPLTYQEIPQNAIPRVGTQCRKMLDLFMGGDSIPEQQLCDEFGRNYRSYLQQLRGRQFQYWRFIDVRENGVIEYRYLDPRHLSKVRYLDALARAERRKELKKESHTEAMSGASRVRQAYKELEAANDELEALKRKAPSQKPSA
ncbi:TPA: hypothetical protein NKQ48_000879 [Vibrio parahaemolyticus]|uniref:hypothetical protein n=1 Tax=Vibrio TaxID=662 RepID=UPI0004125342|nr:MULTISPECIES: hypothetical protein [Vibrio]EHZ2536568.1 hypothetical protein [Vibrio parahaemolyticus]MBE4054814.1 hypothetical protein [Vibrio parahaemolyticus]MDW1966785.1 hypothetical protein [Vibrio sp. Vb0587]TOH54008.1 hypothetical protein CGI79_22120 [Vibrio parahaemolyticus]UJX29832.1 hypothetical protein JHS79_01910 [Vibrio parahaemolyticus]